VVEYYCEKLSDWYEDQALELPHPYILIDDLIFSLQGNFFDEIKLCRYARHFREDYEHMISNGNLFGLGVFLNLNKKEDDLFTHCFSYELNIKGDSKPFIIKTKGSFFDPVHKHWNTPVLEYKYKKLKTKTKHCLSFNNNNAYFEKPSTERKLLALKDECPCTTDIFYPVSSYYTSLLIYACKNCSALYMCDCFKECEPDWKYQLDDLMARHLLSIKKPQITYRNKICHICLGKTPPPMFASTNLNSYFMSRYSPWVYKQAYIDNQKIDSTTLLSR